MGLETYGECGSLLWFLYGLDWGLKDSLSLLHIEAHINVYMYDNDVMTWVHFPDYRPFVQGIQWLPMDS